jgi:anti-sigma regulatory factor (Ser/Thr protein kinase)
MKDRVEFELKNELTEIDRLNSKLEEMASGGLLPEDKLFNINLALEELVTNVISYAYEDEKEHSIRLEFEFDDGKVHIRLIDDGREFDPFAEVDEPDVDAPAEERPIGGLGVHFVRQLMDEYSYFRDDGKNVVSLTKNY